MPPKETETTRASLELLYNISRELTTALEMRAVLERILFLSMRTVGAPSGSIIVLVDHGKPVESAIITGGQMHKHTTQRLRVMLEHGLAGWVARNRQPALVFNTSQDERWMLQKYDLEERTDPKSAVSAPLQVRDRLIGVMTLVHPKDGFFTEEHLALVQAISDQAGIAVLNARLYEESQRQARVMTALAESAAMITGSLKLDNVLRRILEQTSQALAVQAVSLALVDAEKEYLNFQAFIGWDVEPHLKPSLKVGQGITGWVAREGIGTIVQEPKEDPRFDIEIEKRTGLTVRAVACAPIRYLGNVIGVLEVLNPLEYFFDRDALLVLTGIGSLAGTAIRHAQLFESLQAAHQSYRELFEDSIDPILISDWEGQIFEANRQAVLASGYDNNQLQALQIHQLHQINTEQVGEHYENLSPGKTISYESTLHSRDGQEIPIQVYVRQVKVEEKNYLQWMMRDITERKKIDTLREDLLSMIYHDLRSPLGNIVSSLDILDTMLVDNEDTTLHSLIAIGIRSTERIQRLTNSLLDINRFEAGQPVIMLQPSNPIEIIQDVIQTTLPIVETKEQTIHVEMPGQLPLVPVDVEMIRRVIINLVENASKHTPPHSTIHVGAKQEDDWVKIWVEDNGPGIPASEQERIFDKFTRLDNRESTKGLGLGLAFCRLAVERHGGKIWVESQPGQGSRFVFMLPLADIDGQITN
jgi:NtrC-family two-component system sensor histidine kinase KinB